MTIQLLGEICYQTGFFVEYTALRLWRLLRDTARMLAGALLRPPLRLCLQLRHLRLRSLLLPGLAALGLVLLVRRTLAQPLLLAVQINGQDVGCVTSEQVFDAAREDVQSRIASSDLHLEVWPTFTLVQGGTPMTESQMADAILRASADSLCEGTAVYVDGVLRTICGEGEHLRMRMAFLKQSALATAPPGARAEFVHDLRLVDGVFLPDSLSRWEDVLSDSSLFEVQAVVRSSFREAVPFSTEYLDTAELAYGETKRLREGSPGEQEITQDTIYLDGSPVQTVTVDVQLVQAPVNEQILRGTRLKDGMLVQYQGHSFLWPVPEYRQVSRWMGSGHYGADIAAPYGTPIYAAADGTVTTAGWHNHPYSYGNYVIIDHGGGWKTLYGHMSGLAVAQGDTVTQGQIIGYVGNTGYSFGNHCHFEMYSPSGRFSARLAFPDIPQYP